MKIIDRLFSREDLDGDGVCPTYMSRWTLISTRWFKGYVHRFLGDDWAADPHDHPKRFISLGIWGWYYEDRFDSDGNHQSTKKYKAPWLRSFGANHVHRVRASECGNTWTIVIVLKTQREWGFIQDGKWIPWEEYVFEGKYRKSC